jgi:TRAP-type C4-dicarboxylate transport system substrate-binding protein
MVGEEARMTTLLEQALAEVQKLAPEQQEVIAALILEELADEQRWDKTFADSQEALARLAQEVRAKKRAGKTRAAGFDDL